MNGILKTKVNKVLSAAALFVAALIVVAPMTANAAENPLSFTVKQIFITSSSSADSTFIYRFTPLDSGSPMPAGSTADGYTFTITGNGGVQIGPLRYSSQGVYRYELFQMIEQQKPGYAYDKRVYTIEAHVNAALGVELIVRNQDGTKAGDIKFENSCNSGSGSTPNPSPNPSPSTGILPSDPKLMTDPPVRKTVSGDPGHDSTFTFKLVARDASSPMPAGSVNGVKTVTIVGSGQGEFGTWSYGKAGVYYYTVYEVNGGERGYTYDTAEYTITDTVKAENGRLVLSRVVTNELNKPVSTLTFINKFDSSLIENGFVPGTNLGPDDDRPAPWGNGPKTGDDMNTTLYLALFALGGILSAGAAITLMAGGRRRKGGSRQT